MNLFTKKMIEGNLLRNRRKHKILDNDTSDMRGNTIDLKRQS